MHLSRHEAIESSLSDDEGTVNILGPLHINSRYSSSQTANSRYGKVDPELRSKFQRRLHARKIRSAGALRE